MPTFGARNVVASRVRRVVRTSTIRARATAGPPRPVRTAAFVPAAACGISAPLTKAVGTSPTTARTILTPTVVASGRIAVARAAGPPLAGPPLRLAVRPVRTIRLARRPARAGAPASAACAVVTTAAALAGAALLAPLRAVAAASLPILWSPGPVAIFSSRAVIAGTIRDTHLQMIQKSGPPPDGGGPQTV